MLLCALWPLVPSTAGRPVVCVLHNVPRYVPPMNKQFVPNSSLPEAGLQWTSSGRPPSRSVWSSSEAVVPGAEALAYSVCVNLINSDSQVASTRAAPELLAVCDASCGLSAWPHLALPYYKNSVNPMGTNYFSHYYFNLHSSNTNEFDNFLLFISLWGFHLCELHLLCLMIYSFVGTLGIV